MGNRGNFYMVQEGKTEEKGIYFYGHWSGSEMPKILQKTLRRAKKACRLDDEPYFARMLFCDLIASGGRDKALTDETSYGISTYLCDNNHKIIVIDVENQRCGYAKEPTDDKQPMPQEWYTFDKFMEMSDDERDEAFNR